MFKAFGSETPIPTLGCFSARLEVGSQAMSAKFYVLDVNEKCLLGSRTAKALGLLKTAADDVSKAKKF